MERLKFGVEVRDQITGFVGRVTGRAEYISGCSQVLVAPRVDDGGAFRESQWFDEQRLIVRDDSAIVLDNRMTPGPDKSAPKR